MLSMKTRKSGGQLRGGRLPELTAATLRAGWVFQFWVSQSRPLEGTESSPGGAQSHQPCEAGWR